MLQPIQRESDSNYLEFEYFLKIFEMSQGQARKKNAKERAETIAKRREALQ